MSKVSVVIPTYNRAGLLRAPVRSVLHQRFQDFEIIIVDDASSDDTPAVVASLGDARILLAALRQLDARDGLSRDWRLHYYGPQGDYVRSSAEDLGMGHRRRVMADFLIRANAARAVARIAGGLEERGAQRMAPDAERKDRRRL